ncbi:hypothetical protein G4G28_21780 [Massilia sp. Dwa41.01b]|uniref:hypothetical protein n=1 Tax=unclassified Massilia TaxID=2609279 RepID=UPI0015FFE9A6|nr:MULTISPECIES: hypothetical protein [unclassified Massilia]QNA90471.1 hypothetical protein G4G28_21780 [Massilia sp. Dwa41.01b]QNA97701.1 hypothetical protein G4G31_00865 [Massilia sp. Se16.2.3]
MKRISKLLILCLVLAVAGCDKGMLDNPMRKAVREKLKDPDSAKWGEVYVYKNRACLEVNSKNSYGGYTGKQAAWLHSFGGDSWYLDKINEDVCYESPLKELVAIDEAEEAAEKEVIALLAKIGRTVTPHELTMVNKDDPASDKCVVQASKAMTAKRIALGTKPDSRAMWEKDYAEQIAPVISGACKG